MAALRVAEMSGFDAVNHTFTSISTGGFSKRPESIGYWKNPHVEAVVIILMLLGSTNFVSGYLMFKRKMGSVCRNSEMRLEAIIMLISIPMLFLVQNRQWHFTLPESFRVRADHAAWKARAGGWTRTDLEKLK